MGIKLVPSRSVETEDAFEGREFVSIETLLEAFELYENVNLALREYLKSSGISFVQKRNEADLLKELSEKCLGKQDAWSSPIVTKDGWVYWVSSTRHREVLENLAVLYSNSVSCISDFVLHYGIVWQISTLRPSTIMHGNAYIPTREDRKIFELFKVEIIDF